MQHDAAGGVAGRLQLGQALAQGRQHRGAHKPGSGYPEVPLTSASTLLSTATCSPYWGARWRRTSPRTPGRSARISGCPRRGEPPPRGCSGSCSRCRALVGFTAPSATTAALFGPNRLGACRRTRSGHVATTGMTSSRLRRRLTEGHRVGLHLLTDHSRTGRVPTTSCRRAWHLGGDFGAHRSRRQARAVSEYRLRQGRRSHAVPRRPPWQGGKSSSFSGRG